MNELSRIDGRGKTPTQAMKEFAASWWAQPRRTRIVKTNPGDNLRFMMVNGVSIYEVSISGRDYVISRGVTP